MSSIQTCNAQQSLMPMQRDRREENLGKKKKNTEPIRIKCKNDA
jgi:hypothetical protein